MDLLRERDQYLASIRSGELWTRRTEQRDFRPMFDRQTEDALDARDQTPAKWSDVCIWLIVAAAFALVCKRM